VSALAGAAERFADGRPVLVGDQEDETIFVAAAADRVDARLLERLQELGGGMTVLGLADSIARRLELADLIPEARQKLDLSLTTPIDAATGISGGWSLRDQALTMRVAAAADTEPRDLAVPGHVHPARIDERGCDAATAALELTRISRRAHAVTLCAVVDGRGSAVRLRDARAAPGLARLPLVSTAELRSLSISRRAGEQAISCELPTRHGSFRAIGYGPAAGDPATVALVHGDPSTAASALVHVHVACLFGDAFGSLLCDCRAELEEATAAMVREGAGVIIYAKPAEPTLDSCSRDQGIDASLGAGLLRAAGASTIRLSAPARWRADALRACGLDVEP
jgi:3,4-dihydroxy 2-butanone 4-phosphate synthase / GTP cyclohydrolase II